MAKKGKHKKKQKTQHDQKDPTQHDKNSQPHHHQIQTAQSTKESGNKRKRWIKILRPSKRMNLILTAALVVVGLGGIWITFLGVRAYWRANEIAEALNQPHLTIKDPRIKDMEAGKQPYMEITITNSGPLPALDVTIPYRSEIGDLGFYFRLGKYGHPDRSWGNIGPGGGSILVTLRHGDTINVDTVQQLRSGMKNIKIHGRITYEAQLASDDWHTTVWAFIRLTTKGKRLQIPFCYEFDPHEAALVICSTGVFSG